MDIKNIINKSLLNYDLSREANKKYIMNSNPDINKETGKIKFDNKKFDYEILGIFDDQTKVWIWSWLLPSLKQDFIKISRFLLEYGLNLSPDTNVIDQYYLKTQLTNSRFTLKDSFQLEIHLALCCYLSNKNIKFIYPYQLKLSNNQIIVIYYLIK